MQIRRGLAATSAALALFSTNAAAQRFYIGASGGTTRIDSSYPGQVARGYAAYEGGIVTASDATAETVGTRSRIFAGMRLSEVFALEADYTHLGNIKAGYTLRDTPPAPQHGYSLFRWDFKAKANGLALVANARLPYDVTLFGRAGVARTELNRTFNGCSYRDDVGVTFCGEFRWPDVAETRPVAGVGIDWRFADRVALRASWDRYFGVGTKFDGDPHPASGNVGEFDIDYFGIGVTYAF